MENVGESTVLNSLADLATQILVPLVPHLDASPEALPFVTDATFAEDQEIYMMEKTS